MYYFLILENIFFISENEFLIIENDFLELAMSLLDFSTRIPLGTFSISLIIK